MCEQHSEELWMIQGSKAKTSPHTRSPKQKTPTEAEQLQLLLELNCYGVKLIPQFQKTIPDKQDRQKK